MSDDLVRRLRDGQRLGCGDCRDTLNEAASRIAKLEADVRTLRLQCDNISKSWAAETVRAETALAERDEFEKEANFHIELWGKASAHRNALAAWVRELEAGVRLAHDVLWEINTNNYTHDEVCQLNDASVEAILTLAPLIGEMHGKTPEWWAGRAADA